MCTREYVWVWVQVYVSYGVQPDKPWRDDSSNLLSIFKRQIANAAQVDDVAKG